MTASVPRPFSSVSRGPSTLNLARKHHAGFLHASTSECYGNPEVHPQVETYWGNVNPVGKRSVYDEAKRSSDAVVTAWHRCILPAFVNEFSSEQRVVAG